MNDLTRIVYVSTAAFASGAGGAVHANVARILQQARRNNPRWRVGGVLHYADGCLFQCLEGPRAPVNALFATLLRDPRHQAVHVLSMGAIDARQFHRWSMKYVPVATRVRALLRARGFASFDPYRFDERLIEEVLRLLLEARDPSAAPDQHYAGRGVRGWLGRLLGRPVARAPS